MLLRIGDCNSGKDVKEQREENMKGRKTDRETERGGNILIGIDRLIEQSVNQDFLVLLA